MTHDELLAKMVSPNIRRECARGGIIQIHLGRACDLQCVNCTQGSQLRGKPVVMTPGQFTIACKSLKGYWGVVALFGGNPCLSPHFEEICGILREHFPDPKQRGLWSNHPRGKGAICRETFYPAHSNLNCHMSQEAYDEFCRDWPESRGYIKGMDVDSSHGPVFVAMKDLIDDECERNELISRCEINHNWSAMLCVVRGEVRGFFCEIAGAMAMLHENDPSPEWQKTRGVPAAPGWWDQPMRAFSGDVAFACHRCAVPLQGAPAYALSGLGEMTSATHAGIYKPKDKSRPVETVTRLEQLGTRPDRVTRYLPGEKA